MCTGRKLFTSATRQLTSGYTTQDCGSASCSNNEPPVAPQGAPPSSLSNCSQAQSHMGSQSQQLGDHEFDSHVPSGRPLSQPSCPSSGSYTLSTPSSAMFPEGDTCARLRTEHSTVLREHNPNAVKSVI